MKYIVILILIISLNCNAEDTDHDHHNEQHKEKTNKKKSLKAHEHGVSILNISQEENNLSFEFEMPGFDVVGFEYKAKKKEDIKKVKNALNIFLDYTNMIKPSVEGKCKKKSAFSEVINEGTHSEFIAKYILSCSNIMEINKIEIMYFKSFKFSKKLNINIVSKNKSTSYQANKLDNILAVKGHF